MFKSVFSRLFWTNVAIILIVITFASATTAVFLDNYISNRQYNTVVRTSKTIEYLTVAMQIENSDFRTTQIYNNTLAMWGDFIDSDITVINNSGEVIASTAGIKRVPAKYIKGVLENETIREKGTFGNYYEKKAFIVGVPLKYSGSIAGGMFFVSKTHAMTEDVLELLLIFLLSCSIAVLISFAIVYWQAKRITAPIKDINKAVREIASGNFSKRLPIRAADETGQLVSSFNYMADSLEDLETMRTTFISDVSHELRTPMTSISGFVGGILDGTIPPEKERDYLTIVYNESKRLTKLTNDMLEMSKMSSSEYKLDISAFDVNELIRICIIQLGQKIDSKTLELEVEFEKDSMAVLADKDAIQRVIINILDNAIKFSYENTKIIVASGEKNGKAYVSIGNFGLGIEPENMKNIFDRFYKTDKSRTNDKSGAGIGLSLVKNIISLHKQKIWAECIDAKEGSSAKFTKFTFTLELS